MTQEEKDPELEKLLNEKLKGMTNKVEGEVMHLDSKTFDDFLKTHKIAVVDFWAEWCAPCIMLAPIVEELASDYPQVGFGKLNSDESPDIAGRYGVFSLPTILFFRNGEPVDEIVGAVPREEIERRLKSILGGM
ncbi:thioredoxin [Sulfuracidifex metallicus]|uniref:thioredoxin n=1 Tax=Sulfuracidifex metallicus TaxID=47303 RepID=UPI002274FAC6|nr:thioredoxin [Sulfuracidifex metallicus]MCY0849485.1 thioredoxin [Sulfuracidifex metallicus]